MQSKRNSLPENLSPKHHHHHHPNQWAMGKRKIPITKIENDQYRMVSFSKRRKGLFKKAQELSALTGAQIAALILSQAGVPYIFGSPSFESVVEQFLSHSKEIVETSATMPMTDQTTQTISDDGEIIGCSSQNNNYGPSLTEILDEKFEEYCESVEELSVLKDDLEKLRWMVGLAKDLKFAQSSFA